MGNVLLDPDERLVWRDEGRDLALLGLDPSEVNLIPALTWQAMSWPPLTPVEGQYVAFAGFPAEYRENRGRGEIRLNVIGGMMAVTSRSVNNVKCVLPRESLVAILGAQVPPRGTDLGGMSGGPVFHVTEESLELVGVITAFGDDYDLFWMATFDDTPL